MSAEIAEEKRAGELQARLLENAYEPMIAWERDGRIVSWNRAAAELYGFASEQALGGNIHRLLKTVHPIPLAEILQQLAAQSQWSGELNYSTGEGLAITLESHLKLVELPSGRTVVLQCDRDVSLYKQTESAMRQVYGELEQLVEERTQQLAAANRELETFSYSVSHDLRAPLRSLQGFARILTMDYAGKVLDDRAVDLMRRMTSSVTRMGQLIEDLLQLSRVSLTALHVQSLDLSAMAHSILDELGARDPLRTVEIQVQPGVNASADPGLLRLVLENLIGTAWKYTGKTAAPRIAVGAKRESGEPTIYFIEDNGAGFDMEFANQLFAPFQRLHDATEFEGTGVGLATVQRAIHRHAGRIWADSSPGRGAQFFFTLGTRAESKHS